MFKKLVSPFLFWISFLVETDKTNLGVGGNLHVHRHVCIKETCHNAIYPGL